MLNSLSLLANQRVYLVGGAVRDLLLKQPTKDLDFIYAGQVKPLARHIADAFNGDFFMLNKERDMARVILYPNSSDPVELDFSPLATGGLDADLRSRDFTINAMALDLADFQQVIDPLGGAQDLFEKYLRPCSETAFEMDAVRVLRAVRLAIGLRLKIEPQTLNKLRKAAPLLENGSIERQRDELFKILDGSNPSTAIRLLDQLGVISHLLPELDALKGVQQSSPHTLNIWDHTLSTLNELSDLLDLILIGHLKGAAENLKLAIVSQQLVQFRQHFLHHFSRKINPSRSIKALLLFSALYHDVGKPETKEVDLGERTRFIGHEKLGGEIVNRRSRALVLNQAEMVHLQLIIINHMRIHDLAKTPGIPSNKAIYRFFRHTGEVGVEVCLLSLADVLATYGTTDPIEKLTIEAEICHCLLKAKWEMADEAVTPQRLINGDDLQKVFGMKPGPKMGELLEAVMEAQVAGEFIDRNEAFLFIEKWLIGNNCLENIGGDDGR